jgi:hypothetical protein
LSALGVSTAAPPAAAVEPEVAPQAVSSCSLGSDRTKHPDRMYLTCYSGSGYVQVEGYCYYFDYDLHKFSSAWFYKQPGVTLRVTLSCSSTWPFLWSAWVDYDRSNG